MLRTTPWAVRSRGYEGKMGAFCDDELTFSSNYNFACSQDLRFSKNVHDNVHGNIYLDPLFLKFVDTEQFQRLRDLKQLGECKPCVFFLDSSSPIAVLR